MHLYILDNVRAALHFGASMSACSTQRALVSGASNKRDAPSTIEAIRSYYAKMRLRNNCQANLHLGRSHHLRWTPSAKFKTSGEAQSAPQEYAAIIIDKRLRRTGTTKPYCKHTIRSLYRSYHHLPVAARNCAGQYLGGGDASTTAGTSTDDQPGEVANHSRQSNCVWPIPKTNLWQDPAASKAHNG